VAGHLHPSVDMKPNRILLTGTALFVASAVGLGCASTEESSSNATTQTTAAKQPSKEDYDTAVKELGEATNALAELNVPNRVSPARLQKTHCAIVVPSLVTGAFIVGATKGKGVATCRQSATSTDWSAPIFVDMTGGSIGLQAGGQSARALLLVMSSRSMDKLFTSGFKLGTDASVAAGPVGKSKTAGTDVSSNADIITYATAKGAYLGVNFSGMSVKLDSGMIAGLYGAKADARNILSGTVPVPHEARPFIDHVKSVILAKTPSLARAE
jgi:lipid-binding SYLF domain-containing protein